MLVVYCKTKSQCHSRGWRMDWDLISVYSGTESCLSLSHTQTEPERNHKPLPCTCTFSISLPRCQQTSPCLLTWNNMNAFFRHRGHPFLFISAGQPEYSTGRKAQCLFFVSLRGSEKQSLSSSECKDAERHRERGERGARTLLGTLNNSVNQALRKAEQVKIFVCFPQWQFQRDVNTRPLTLKGYNTTHCFFYTHSIAVGEMLYGSTICFALWWILVWNEMHAGRSHDM